MTGYPVNFPVGRIALPALALALVLSLSALNPQSARGASEATETFHLAEIAKIMVGYNGDTAIQAVEIKMLNGGQNLVNGLTIAGYDGAGVKIGTSGTFAGNVPNGVAGGRILCATTKFQMTFGIIPDLILTGGLPVLNGQVSYETVACRVNSIGYGSVATPLTGTTLAPPLPAQGATILIRRIDSPTTVTCPLTEDAGARFVQKQGTTASPDTFTNNSGQSVLISSTIAGVATPPSAMPVVRVFPNPFHGSTRIEAPDWQPLTIHDIRGRLVRVLTCIPGGACPQIAGPYQGDWNGTDFRGRPVASGIYYLQYTGRSGPIVRRIVVMR